MKFVGSYVQRVKSILVASAVSGHNAMWISSPGWGKSEMSLQAARKLGGENGTIFVELDPSSPPELIRGAYDPAAMLQGNLVRLVHGTPYDPQAHVVILDEIWRANDVVFDALIHATNNKTLADPLARPVFWGTANFVGRAERSEALRDRFAFWYHMDGDMNPRDVATAHLSNGTHVDPGFTNDFPDWNECLRIRRTQPSSRALEAVSDMVSVLSEEAERNNFAVNPRRIVQWSEILYRTSVLYRGSEDFDRVHENAARLMVYAYPCIDRETASKWARVALSCVDAVGESIEAYLSSAIETFNQVASGSLHDRMAMITALGEQLAKCETDLKRIGGSDPRVEKALVTMRDLFAKAVTKQPLTES